MSSATITVFREKFVVLNMYIRKKKCLTLMNQIPPCDIRNGSAKDTQSKQNKGNNKGQGRLMKQRTEDREEPTKSKQIL